MNFREQAIRLFTKFHLRKPRQGEVATLRRAEDEVVFKIGELSAIQYAIDGHKKDYYHKFAKSGRPLLLSSADGSQIFILKGRWKFTDRGFMNK
jgi:hypothetical protein